MKTNKLRLSLALTAIAILSITFFSCNISKRLANYNDETKMIPADFNPNKQILLFAEIHKKNNVDARHTGGTKKIEKIIKQFYPYKYEIVSRKDIMDKNSKYSDTSIYKYAILYYISGVQQTTKTTSSITTNSSSPYMNNGIKNEVSVAPTATVTLWDFHFYDRNLDKSFPSSGYALSVTDNLKAFIKTINKAKGEMVLNK